MEEKNEETSQTRKVRKTRRARETNQGSDKAFNYISNKSIYLIYGC